MKIESQVCSLQLAKELKEAGYPQEGLWWWGESGTIPKSHSEWLEDDYSHQDKPLMEYIKTRCVAPTVCELGEALPKETYSIKTMQWAITSVVHNDIYLYADTEANARAKMWLYLKKEKLL